MSWQDIVITVHFLKFKTKRAEKVLVCGITNTNIKQNYWVSILTYFVEIINNRHKIISVQKIFHEETNFFGKKIMGRLFYKRTNN